MQKLNKKRIIIWSIGLGIAIMVFHTLFIVNKMFDNAIVNNILYFLSVILTVVILDWLFDKWRLLRDKKNNK